jgi:ABC-type hemin transport system ATPase subunit
VTLFCGRFLQLLVWEPQLRTCRLSIAEAERLPGSPNAYFDAIFATTFERLTAYLVEHYTMDRSQRGVLYVFDEPSTGLHPLDVGTLVGVFDRLLDAGATIIVIDHDLDLLATADYLIDMGPGGGPGGGRIVAQGTPRDVARDPGSVTAPWLAAQLGVPAAGEPAAGEPAAGR